MDTTVPETNQARGLRHHTNSFGVLSSVSTAGENRASRMDDARLIRAAQQGNAAAFEQLVQQYDRAVLRLTIHLTGSQEDGQDMYQEAFPWDRLDQVPDRYFDRIPTPWPPAENNFTRLLTDAGFGTKYNVEFFANGQTIKKDLEVVPSPPHFDSAARYKN